MSSRFSNYQKIELTSAESKLGQAWLSPATSDSAWDDFLRKVPSGQYQQSSLWSEFKAFEGWKHHRVVVTKNETIVGGYQLLWKSKGLMRFGYVSKGPVTQPDYDALIHHLIRHLHISTKELQLSALIFQQPDESAISLPEYGHIDTIQTNPLKVIEATYLVDLHDSVDKLTSGMSPSLRRNLRKGHKQKVLVREGTEADLPLFFDLMSASCRRQKTSPNPGSLASLQRLWTIFSRDHSIRMTLAECNKDTPAAKLSLVFGKLATVWKKGWDGTHSASHPNEILEEDALHWAKRLGCHSCDFCSFGRSSAEQICKGEEVTNKALSSRDEYHLRFGGRPMLLPRAQLIIPNYFLNWGYRNIMVPLERRRAKQVTPNVTE